MPYRTADERKCTSREDTTTDEGPSPAILRARELVQVQRDINGAEITLADLKERRDKLKAQVQADIEEDRLPESSTVSGASVHIKRQVWSGPAVDHAALTAVLKKLRLTELMPSTVHSGQLSSFVREHLDPDETMTLEERLLSPEPKALDPRLYAALKVTEKIEVGVTGAGATPKEPDAPIETQEH